MARSGNRPVRKGRTEQSEIAASYLVCWSALRRLCLVPPVGQVLSGGKLVFEFALETIETGGGEKLIKKPAVGERGTELF